MEVAIGFKVVGSSGSNVDWKTVAKIYRVGGDNWPVILRSWR